MHRFFFSRKALTKVQAAVIATILVVAVFVGVVYYLSLSTPATYSSPTSPTKDFEWSLLVDGFVQRPLNLTLNELVAMPRSTVYAELYCLPAVGSSGVLVDHGNWTGVRLELLLEKAGVSPQAVKVAFYAEDGFTTDLTVTTAMREDIVLAYEKDGKPLPEKLRLAVPNMWGYKWIKWLIHIEVVDYDFKGRYESRGFPDNAEIP
jgi:DMSO/TMAO reductase YedYZ molybdopterin-dependent catalytic subunit